MGELFHPYKTTRVCVIIHTCPSFNGGEVREAMKNHISPFCVNIITYILNWMV